MVHGVDFVILDGIYNSISREEQSFDGVQFSGGIGVGFDIHVNQSQTKSFTNKSSNAAITTRTSTIGRIADVLHSWKNIFGEFY